MSMEVDDCYINDGVIEKITKIINDCSDKSGVSIGVDAPIGYGKSEVAKKIVNHFNDTNKIIPIYIECNKYDFDVSLENTISACVMPLIEYIKKRKEGFADWDTIAKSLKEIGKAIIDLDPRIKNILTASKKIFKAQSPSKFKNTKIETIKILTSSIEKMLLNEKKYIFIFDNLDKCNPSFSLKMFETIKFVLTNITKKLNFVIFIDFEYLTLLHEGIFSKNINLQYYYRQMFDYIIKMDLRKRSDFFESKICGDFKSFYMVSSDLRTMINEINEKNKIPLRSLEYAIKELENLIDNKIYLEKNNLWIVHILYSFIVMNIVHLKKFNKIVYDNEYIGSKEMSSIDFFRETHYNLFFSDKPILKNKLQYFDGYSSTYFNHENTFFEKSCDGKEIIIKNKKGDQLANVSIDKFYLCGLLNVEDSEKFQVIFTFEDISKYNIEKLQSMTFKDYVKYKINNYTRRNI